MSHVWLFWANGLFFGREIRDEGMLIIEAVMRSFDDSGAASTDNDR
jgi:hypothetical protein